MKTDRALFLDRDGVINEEVNYAFRIDQISFMPGIFDLVKIANRKKYRVIVITNQAGIAKGYYSVRDYINLMKWMKQQFLKQNCNLDNIYFCPFHPEGEITKFKKESPLRKPAAGMVIKALERFNLDKEKSILVGDRITDIMAGQAASIKTNFLFGENEKSSNLPFNFLRVNHLADVIPYL